MALVITAQLGAIEYGVIAFTGLATATGLVAFPPASGATDPRNGTSTLYPVVTSITEKDRQAMAILLRANATQTFNIDYQFTADNGATWQNGVPIPSSTVTVDGGRAGYTQSAELNVQVGYQYRVQIWNSSGSTLDGAYEWRLYTDN